MTLNPLQSFDFRKAVLEARNEATPDGVLVVDQKGKMLLHNKNFVHIWQMPQAIIDNNDDKAALEHAMNMVADPEGFIRRVYLIYQNSDECSYDEIFFRDGRVIERYGKAVIGDDGTNYGWAWFFRDISERKQEERRHRTILESLPQMAWTASPSGEPDYYNHRWYEYTGKTFADLKGEGWKTVVHPDERKELIENWMKNLLTEETFEAEARFRRWDNEYRWHIIKAVPIKKDNAVLFWVGTCTDTHDQKLSNQLLEESRDRLVQLANAMPQLVWIAEPDGSVSYYNNRIQEYAGAIRTEEGNWQWRSIILHPDDEKPTADAWQQAVAAESFYEKEHRVKMQDGSFRWHLSRGLPQRNAEGIVVKWYGTATDIHELKQFEEKLEKRIQERTTALEEQRNLMDAILKHSPAGITVYQAIRNKEEQVEDFQCILANDAAEEFTSISNAERYTKTVLQITPDLKASPLFQMAVVAVEKGTPFQTEYYNSNIKKWLELSVVKLHASYLINVFRDITPIKEVQFEIERSAERLKAVFDASQMGMFTFAPVCNEQNEIIDFRFVITNPSFAAYVGQTPETLNGQLGSQWFPGYLTNGVFDMYKQTFLTGEKQRYDIHYNVDQHDIYLDLQSTKVGEEVLVTFHDYTPLKKAQLQLERTVDELKRSNINLEEFAYAASHDLKEPVRKIQVFTDRLKSSLENQLNEEQRHFFRRVEFAAKRMSSLIEDLLLYSYITKGATFEQEVELNNKVALVLQDLDLEIEQKGATVNVENLPMVKAHRRQMQQLFHNLIGNALKYSKPDIPPQINISSRLVKGNETSLRLSSEEANRLYHLIEVQDNGIGFPPEDAERIFHLFTRLHGNMEYRGSGVGLSIVQRIVENHRGHVWAESEPGNGATFNVLLPAS